VLVRWWEVVEKKAVGERGTSLTKESKVSTYGGELRLATLSKSDHKPSTIDQYNWRSERSCPTLTVLSSQSLRASEVQQSRK
jgi:hypothetical protein